MVLKVGPTASVRRERLRPMRGQLGIFVIVWDASVSTRDLRARDAAMVSQQCCQINS
jgi:hypothetical protein